MFASFKLRSVRTKLLLAFLVLGLTPVAVVSLIMDKDAERRAETDLGGALGQISFNVADKIDRNYFERYGDVQAFAMGASRIRDWEKIASLADEFMVAYGFYDLMLVADSAGKVVVVNSVDAAGKPIETSQLLGSDVSHEEWFLRAKNGGIKPGETYAQPPARDPTVTRLYGNEEIVVPFTAPIRDTKGAIIGVWRNYSSLQRIADGIMDAARSNYEKATGLQVKFTLIDEQGLELHDDIDESGELQVNLAQKGWAVAHAAAGHGTGWEHMTDPKSKVEYVAGYGASEQEFKPQFGWSTIARVDYATAMAPVAALRTRVVGLVAAAIVLIVLAAVAISGTIAKPIAATADAMGAISEDGDLTKRLSAKSRDELGQLAKSFNSLLVRLGEIATGINGASHSVATASRELSTVADDISSAAQSQASSLEQTAASMEHITATVKQNAENASQASRLAVAAREVADKGGRVVGDAVSAMSEINRSSKKIAEIITTIDEIAFQTNLLALNAAVEAARAGSQGRGFAVVAAEVRSLAARSASAAKEIKGLIQESSAKVDQGTTLVNQSGAALDEITNSVKRVTDIVAEIAAASREQSVGIDEVNRAVSQMDQITQRNAAQNEELSATAGTLSAQARELDQLVSWFKLEEQRANGAALHVGRGKSNDAMRRRPENAPAVSAVGASASMDLDGFIDF